MVKNLTSVKERVLYYLEKNRIPKAEFFENVGISYSNFKGGNLSSELSSDKLVKILTALPELSPKWMLLGVGEETLSAPITSSNDLKSLPLIPIDAMAGFGNGEMQVLEHECEVYSIPIFKDADFLITVKGSSMYPKYNSGDIVACKKLSLRDAFFQWNKVYVLDTEQGALVKRVKKSTDSECILLVSDNKDYDPFDIHLTQVRALALVVGVIRLE